MLPIQKMAKKQTNGQAPDLEKLAAEVAEMKQGYDEEVESLKEQIKQLESEKKNKVEMPKGKRILKKEHIHIPGMGLVKAEDFGKEHIKILEEQGGKLPSGEQRDSYMESLESKLYDSPRDWEEFLKDGERVKKIIQ